MTERFIRTPMSPGSPIARSVEKTSDGAHRLNASMSFEWGDFSADRIWDNESDDWPPSALTDVLALEPVFDVFRWQNADLEPEHLEALATAPVLKGVRYLDLRRNKHVQPDSLTAFFRAAALEHVEWLSIDSCLSADDSVVAAIVENLPNLRGIELGSTVVTDAGLLALSGLPNLETVEATYLSAASAQGIDALLAAKPGLSWLITCI